MDANKAPLRITLYDPETNEVVGDYTRVFVPWGILKKALGLMEMDRDHLKSDDIDAIAALVVAAFGDQFTVSDLDKGADLEEMMAVVDSIISRASLGQRGGRQVPKSAPLPEVLPKILREE